MDEKKPGLTYSDAGVDIDAGNRAVELIKKHIKSTDRQGVMGGFGGFGGLFALDMAKYKNPVLVSGTDGVGTKLKIAFMLDKHDTIGQDAVAMCVNDILTLGAEPLFFLDYLAVGKLEAEQAAQIVSGVARGCSLAGCALIGGETAEMAGFYENGEYDIAGFAVGAVDAAKIIAGEQKIKQGDALIGVKSSGLHSNGYSLVRKICFEVKKMAVSTRIAELGRTLGEELLEPTKIYVKACLPLLDKFNINGLIHITGGGFYENIPRILPDGVGVKVNTSAWAVPPIFSLLEEWGNVSKAEMYRTFNMGIGMIIIAPAQEAQAIISDLAARGEEAFVIGEVVPGEKIVTLTK